VVFDAEARSVPSASPAAPPRDDAHRLRRLLSLVQRFFGRHVEVSADELARLGPDDQVRYVAVKLAEAKILPVDLGPERLRDYLRVGEATAVAFEAYRAGGRYPVPTLLFRAREANADDDRLGLAEHDETLGWRTLAAGDVTIHWVPGDHVTMMTHPHVTTIAEVLRSAIRDRAVGR
jgi:thioesterase domain-containing protein